MCIRYSLTLAEKLKDLSQEGMREGVSMVVHAGMALA